MPITQFVTTGDFLINGLLIASGKLDLNGEAGGLILDANADTHLGASTDDTINITIAGASDFTLTPNSFNVLSGSTIAGPSSTFGTFIPITTQQALSGAGAVNITSYYTAWTTLAANAGTLADGVVKGQLKKIQLVVDGGDGTLTPTNLANGTTLTFANAGDFALLYFNGTDWVALELGNDASGTGGPTLT